MYGNRPCFDATAASRSPYRFISMISRLCIKVFSTIYLEGFYRSRCLLASNSFNDKLLRWELCVSYHESSSKRRFK